MLMTTFQAINGWTKATMLQQILTKNNGRRAVDQISAPICLYQDQSGNRCFVGAFIPDHHPALDNAIFPLDELLEDYPDLKACMPLDIIGLCELQGLHDRSFNKSTHLAAEEWISQHVTDPKPPEGGAI
jgi:hypothetical protein